MKPPIEAAAGFNIGNGHYPSGNTSSLNNYGWDSSMFVGYNPSGEANFGAITDPLPNVVCLN
jgi:hypothetical protein